LPDAPEIEAALEQVGPPVVESPRSAMSPLRVAGSLFGAGAAVGGGAVAAITARRRRRVRR